MREDRRRTDGTLEYAYPDPGAHPYYGDTLDPGGGAPTPNVLLPPPPPVAPQPPTLRPTGPDWFAANAPSGSDYGAPPAAFGEQYSAGQYAPPTWQEAYAPPTIEELLADPGYQIRLNAGLQAQDRSAAARGSILSGGHLKGLQRFGQEYASTEYGNLNQRKTADYQQRYGQFSDAAQRGANAFAANETGRLNQFNTRYKSYQDSVLNRRESERDRWAREMDLSRLGLDAYQAGRP